MRWGSASTGVPLDEGARASKRRRAARLLDPRGSAVSAGIVAGVAFGLMGWSRLLVPALIRSVEDRFGQTDAGMGLYYGLVAIVYAFSSFAAGAILVRLGTRVAVSLAAVAFAAGLLVQGTATSWLLFVLAALPGSFGGAAIDVGINSLYLDLFHGSRGRALNLLHLAYSVAALAAPLAVALVVGAGLPWEALFIATGAAWIAMTLALLLATPHRTAAPPRATGDAARRREHGGRRVPLPLVVMSVAIGCYVASEAGVSDWVVRFLADLPLALASLALTLFWGGVTVGRLGFARVGDRLDPLRSGAVLALVAAVLLAVVAALPTGVWALALFAAIGVAFGPVYPLIVAAAGTRFPGRSALVTSTLTVASVLGALVYPPAIGFLSVTVGLRVALLGTAVLAAASAVALVVSGRAARR